MPLSKGYVIFGDCGNKIEVVDYDYNAYTYKSSIDFETKGDTKGITVSLSSDPITQKKFSARIVTTSTLYIETPLEFELIANVSKYIYM